MRLVLFSLSFAGLSLGSSCGSGPKVTVCVVAGLSEPPHLVCVDPADRVTNLSLPESDNYVALPPNDMRTLIEYCGLKGRDKAAVQARAETILQIAKDAMR